MANIEERLTALEQGNTELKHDNAELKQKIELQTIAIGGLVNKAMLERINEKNDKIFKTLIAHDEFTNRQLSELREQVSELREQVSELDEKVEIQVGGKIVGMQTEMRQSFTAIDARFDVMNTRFDQISLVLNSLVNKSEQG